MVWETQSPHQARSQGPLSPLVPSVGMRIWDVKLVKVEGGTAYPVITQFQLQLGVDC